MNVIYVADLVQADKFADLHRIFLVIVPVNVSVRCTFVI